MRLSAVAHAYSQSYSKHYDQTVACLYLQLLIAYSLSTSPDKTHQLSS